MNDHFKKYFRFTLQLFGWGFLGLVMLMVAVAMGVFGKLPSIEELKNPKEAVSTQIFSDDFELMGKFYYENRTELTYNQIPKYTVDALIATEDNRFYEHSGIDVWGMSTAFFRTIVLRKPSGASTITQQLAKNLFHNAERRNFLVRGVQKIKEWYIAIQLERNFSKEEILALYLNTVPFLHNSFGLKEAARTYFNKDSKQLKIEESAVLIGMLKGPGLYNPKTRPQNAFRRRNVVLDQMEKYGYLTKTQVDSLKKIPLKIDYHLTSENTGLAPYLREQIRIELDDILNKYSKADGEAYNIYTDGLKIYTTIDSRIQKYAEDAMSEFMPTLQNAFLKDWGKRDPWKHGSKANPELIDDAIRNLDQYKLLREDGSSHDEVIKLLSEKQSMRIFTWNGDRDTMMSVIDSMKYYKKILHAGLCAVDPISGEIKAWVGGINFQHFKLDHVRESTKRQVGSTIKPFLYAVAIDNGNNPCFEVPYTKPLIPGFESWDPKGTKFFKEGEMVKIKDGLQVSDNRVTAQLLKVVGISNMVEMMRNLGIKSNIDEVASIALGVTDISLIEMIGAYTPFMNQGIYSTPYYIKRIEDNKGNVIFENRQNSKEVLSERTAAIVNQMMQLVTTGRGTASRLRGQYGLKMEIAGKTGTTQSNSDGWFIGATPTLLCGVWVGADDPSVTFASTSLGQGASSALPIWAKTINKSYNDRLTKLNRKTSFLAPADSSYRLEFYCDSTILPIVDSNTLNVVGQ